MSNQPAYVLTWFLFLGLMSYDVLVVESVLFLFVFHCSNWNPYFYYFLVVVGEGGVSTSLFLGPLKLKHHNISKGEFQTVPSNICIFYPFVFIHFHLFVFFLLQVL